MTEALVASLGMYDFPWTAKANDALWTALADRLRAAGIDAPSGLARGADLHETWRDPRLILGQTCGYPYVATLRGRVALVATPIYAFAGCQGAWHRSFLLAGKRQARRSLADFAGARAALNARDSNSGMNLFRAMIAPLAHGRPFFGKVIVTPVTPALPFIMSADLAQSHLSAVRAALFATLDDPALAAARKTLGLVGAEIFDDADYDRVAQIERDAIALHYEELA